VKKCTARYYKSNYCYLKKNSYKFPKKEKTSENKYIKTSWYIKDKSKVKGSSIHNIIQKKYLHIHSFLTGYKKLSLYIHTFCVYYMYIKGTYIQKKIGVD